jgi:N-carbamoylputrescine amidase
MSSLRMAAVAAPFDRDLEASFARIERLVADARADGIRLIALPEACLGGYLADLDGEAEGPPALRLDGPEIRRLSAIAGDAVIAAGYCEEVGDSAIRYNSAVCTSRSRRTPPTGPATTSPRSTARSAGSA